MPFNASISLDGMPSTCCCIAHHRPSSHSSSCSRDVTEYLQQLLRRSGDGIDLHTSAEKEVVKHIKETVCYVASDPAKEEYRLEAEAKANQLVEYRLPDGSTIHIGSEAFRAPEILFHPDLVGEEYPGVQQCVVNAIHRSDLDLRKNLYANVVLAGGSTMFPGAYTLSHTLTQTYVLLTLALGFV